MGGQWSTSPAISQSWTALGNLAPQLDELSTKLFFDSYIIDGIGYCSIDEKLASAMRAVGVAALSNLAKEPALMQLAWRNYITAVQLTNSSFGELATATEDTTLLTTLILGMFEIVSGDTVASIAKWSHHINGAAKLVVLRGPQQLRNSLGLRLFRQVAANLYIYSIHTLTPMPEEIVVLHYEASRNIDRTDLAWRTQEECIMFSRLLNREKIARSHDRSDLISRALALDQLLLASAEESGPQWHYQAMQEQDVTRYVFPNSWTAYIWNIWRLQRIFVYTFIRDILLEGPDMSSIELEGDNAEVLLQSSVLTIATLRSEIMATTPWRIDSTTAPMQTSPTSEVQVQVSSNERVDTHMPILRTGGSAFVVWPFYSIGLRRVCSPSEQEDVIRILQTVSEFTGIHQAAVFAELLRNEAKGGSEWT